MPTIWYVLHINLHILNFFTINCFADSYLGMDQQQELKLDVKKAPAPPTDHPQWDLSESEHENNDQQENLSDYTTDSSDEEDSD